MTALAAVRSPCRIAAERPNHACSVEHATSVQAFHAAQHAQQLRAEAWSLGYATELAEFYSTVEIKLTWKRWLLSSRQGTLDISADSRDTVWTDDEAAQLAAKGW